MGVGTGEVLGFLFGNVSGIAILWVIYGHLRADKKELEQTLKDQSEQLVKLSTMYEQRAGRLNGFEDNVLEKLTKIEYTGCKYRG